MLLYQYSSCKSVHYHSIQYNRWYPLWVAAEKCDSSKSSLLTASVYSMGVIFNTFFGSNRPSAELNQLVSWQRLQRHVGRPIPERLFVLVHNPAIDGQPLGGNGRPRDGAAQAFQAAALIRFTDGGGVQ